MAADCTTDEIADATPGCADAAWNVALAACAWYEAISAEGRLESDVVNCQVTKPAQTKMVLIGFFQGKGADL